MPDMDKSFGAHIRQINFSTESKINRRCKKLVCKFNFSLELLRSYENVFQTLVSHGNDLFNKRVNSSGPTGRVTQWDSAFDATYFFMLAAHVRSFKIEMLVKIKII